MTLSSSSNPNDGNREDMEGGGGTFAGKCDGFRTLLTGGFGKGFEVLFVTNFFCSNFFLTCISSSFASSKSFTVPKTVCAASFPCFADNTFIISSLFNPFFT